MKTTGSRLFAVSKAFEAGSMRRFDARAVPVCCVVSMARDRSFKTVLLLMTAFVQNKYPLEGMLVEQLHCSSFSEKLTRCPGVTVNGEWHLPRNSKPLIDPWNGEEFMKIPDPQIDEVEPFVESLRKVPKTGLHNPLKNPQRCELDPLGSLLPVALSASLDCPVCKHKFKGSVSHHDMHHPCKAAEQKTTSALCSRSHCMDITDM